MSDNDEHISYDIIDDHAEDEEGEIKENVFHETSKSIPNLPKAQPANIQSNVNNYTFDDKIKEYLAANRVKLAILTPCYGSLCFVNYVQCLMATNDLCHKYGIEVVIEFCRNDSLVSRARNNLVAKAMNDPNVTHVLFIDADITWSPIDVFKLILSDKSLVGGVYPLKSYFWDKIINDEKNPNVVQSWIDRKNNSQFKDRISDREMIQYNLLKYNINYIGTQLAIQKNLARVKHLATGFMMFKRKVIEQMSRAFPSTKYVDDVGFLSGTENDHAYALFDCGVEDGHYYSEDWLFCHRWSKMGGSIWIDVSISLMHTGNEDFRGCYLASIM
uniref:Nucleotide-diphospho-sugar transferase domain-containing protein n=1 Tax=viral metagenome TaxID=1070528 RepID=A0A6C0DSH8_9ZZZZ